MNIYDVPARVSLEMSNYSRAADGVKRSRQLLRRSTRWVIFCGAFTLWFAVIGTITLHDKGWNGTWWVPFGFMIVFGVLTGMYVHQVVTWRKLLTDARFVVQNMSTSVSFLTFLLTIGDPLMSQDRR